jgi:hypothetical protein
VRSRSVGRNGDYHYYKDEDFVRGPRYRHRMFPPFLNFSGHDVFSDSPY